MTRADGPELLFLVPKRVKSRGELPLLITPPRFPPTHYTSAHTPCLSLGRSGNYLRVQSALGLVYHAPVLLPGYHAPAIPHSLRKDV